LLSGVPPVVGFSTMRTDLETSLLTKLSPSVVTTSRFIRLTCSGILIISCTIFGYAQCYAQDVAEAARQEKARKENQQKKTKHVYTDEDLKKAQILTPEDREVVEAKKRQQPLPGTVAPQESLDAQALSDQLPLGDVARHYRAMRELQRLQQLAKFHLPFADVPVLAAPQPAKPVELVAPEAIAPSEAKHPVVRVRPIIEIPAEPKIEPYRPPVKRSPFERPRMYLPGPARTSHPSGSQLTAPKVPAFSETPSQSSGISVTPLKPAAPDHGINAASSPRLTPRGVTATPAAPDVRSKLVRPSTLGPATPSRPAAPAPSFDAMPSPRVTPHGSTAPPAASVVRSSPANPSQIFATPSKPAAPPPDLSVMPGPTLAPNVTNPKPVAPVVRAVPAAPSPLHVEPVQPVAPAVALAPSRAAKAGVAPAGPVAPAAPGKLNVVVVKPGDSLWKLAEENLGQGARWHELLSANPAILDANHIEASSQIFLPSIASSYRSATRIIVRKGDTLSKIAAEKFGRGSYASCIAAVNPAVQDVNKIYESQVLVLPASCRP